MFRFDVSEWSSRDFQLRGYADERLLDAEATFVCAVADACKASCIGVPEDQFFEGQLPFFGSHYGLTDDDGRVPRVLTVGKDMGRPWRRVTLDQRALIMRHLALEHTCFADPQVPPHDCEWWKKRGRSPELRSNAFVLRILYGIDLGRGTGSDRANEFVQVHDSSGKADRVNILFTFAKTNALLCSAIVSGASTAPSDRMFRECRVHFNRQLEIFQPTVIVVQGGDAQVSFDRMVGALPRIEGLPLVARTKSITGSETFVCYFPHPAPSANSTTAWANWTGSGGDYLRGTIKPTLERVREMLRT